MTDRVIERKPLHVQGYSTDHVWAMEDVEGFVGLRFDCGDSGTLYLTRGQAKTLLDILLIFTDNEPFLAAEARVKELSPEYLLTCAQVSNHDFEKRIHELEAMLFEHDKRNAEVVADLQRQIGLEIQAREAQKKVLEMAERMLRADEISEEEDEEFFAAIAALQKPEVPE